MHTHHVLLVDTSRSAKGMEGRIIDNITSYIDGLKNSNKNQEQTFLSVGSYDSQIHWFFKHVRFDKIKEAEIDIICSNKPTALYDCIISALTEFFSSNEELRLVVQSDSKDSCSIHKPWKIKEYLGKHQSVKLTLLKADNVISDSIKAKLGLDAENARSYNSHDTKIFSELAVMGAEKKNTI